jgi:hypothetical protein
MPRPGRALLAHQRVMAGEAQLTKRQRAAIVEVAAARDAALAELNARPFVDVDAGPEAIRAHLDAHAREAAEIYAAYHRVRAAIVEGRSS